jgi:hypothetical protein
MPQSSCEFRKNRVIESGTVLRDVCVLPTLSPFSSSWTKFFSTGDITELLNDYEFHENRRSESHTSREVVNEFLPALSTFIHRFVEIQCKRSAYHFLIS